MNADDKAATRNMVLPSFGDNGFCRPMQPVKPVERDPSSQPILREEAKR